MVLGAAKAAETQRQTLLNNEKGHIQILPGKQTDRHIECLSFCVSFNQFKYAASFFWMGFFSLFCSCLYWCVWMRTLPVCSCYTSFYDYSNFFFVGISFVSSFAKFHRIISIIGHFFRFLRFVSLSHSVFLSISASFSIFRCLFLASHLVILLSFACLPHSIRSNLCILVGYMSLAITFGRYYLLHLPHSSYATPLKKIIFFQHFI